MPFDLYVSRASTFAAMRGDASSPPKQGLLSRTLSRAAPSPPVPITSKELHALMEGAPAARKGDHIYWVSHPEGDVWFVAEWKDEGNLLLSTSYAHPRFLRNFADMIEQGLVIAAGLRARLFEEVGGREITKKNLDALLSPSGKYVELQARTWRHAMDQLSVEGRAALELPLGAIDVVSEFLLFHVIPEQPIADRVVTSLFEGADQEVNVIARQPGAWLVVDRDSDQALTKILRRPDGKWQLWPAWGQVPFAQLADATVTAAERLGASGPGALQLNGRTYDDALRGEVRSRIGGLGVDFYTWTQGLA